MTPRPFRVGDKVYFKWGCPESGYVFYKGKLIKNHGVWWEIEMCGAKTRIATQLIFSTRPRPRGKK